jgi:hypothetical protein
MFSSHVATAGFYEISPKVRDPSLDPPVYAFVMAVHASLAMGLGFESGMEFKAEVRSKFCSIVHPLVKSNHFLLVVLDRLSWILVSGRSWIRLPFQLIKSPLLQHHPPLFLFIRLHRSHLLYCGLRWQWRTLS